MMYGISQFGYLVASALFIFALHWMNAPATARKGVYAGVAGTAMAIIVTWAEPSVIHHVWIILAIVAGFIVGVPLSIFAGFLILSFVLAAMMGTFLDYFIAVMHDMIPLN